MSNTILVTDSLFISEENEAALRGAGFEVERLDLPKATEQQLVEAIVGKCGYILGGIENVTAPVIEAADGLKAIAFTGSGVAEFIPAHELATKKGIAISTAPDGVTNAVAEYTLAVMLMMTRELLELGRTGSKSFGTTPTLTDQRVGIVGLGRIGTKVAADLKALGVKEVVYSNRTRKPDVEARLGIEHVDLDELLGSCDVISLHLAKAAGPDVVTADQLKLVRDGGLLVNLGYPESVNFDALYAELSSGRLRAAYDEVHDERFKELPLHNWFGTNGSSAFNTHDAIKRTSDSATASMINMLTTGEDTFLANPEYRSHR